MRKLLAVLLITCFLLTASAVGFAATTGNAVAMFSDVPANHWAYSAIAQLQKDGIVTGETPTTFAGSRTITRYEAAVMIANVMKKFSAVGGASLDNVSKQDRSLIQRLAAEFAAELDAMGVKVDALQAQVTGIQAQIDLMPKFSFQAQIQIDPNTTPVYDKTTKTWGTQTSPNTLMFVQPQINGNIDGNWKYYAELRFIAPLLEGPLSDPPSLRNQYFDNRDAIETMIRSAYFYGSALGQTWYVGRFEDNLPFTNTAGHGGLVTDSRLDGARMAFASGSFKGDLFAGFDINGVQTKFQPNNPVNHQPELLNQALLTGLDMGYNMGPANVSLGYYQGWGQYNKGGNDSSNYPFTNLSTPPAQFIEIGADYQLTPMIQVTAFAATNASAYALVGQTSAPSIGSQQNLSWLGRLDYGTYNPAVKGSMNVYGMYASTGANSVWTSPNYDVSSLSWGGPTWDTISSSGIDAYGMNGNAQGFEIGLDWAPAKNMDWHLSYSYTTAIDQNLAAAQATFINHDTNVSPMNQARQIYKSEFTVFF
ncbi:MAG: S-layer homology domain-containing protein [Bacillota bacterium]